MASRNMFQAIAIGLEVLNDAATIGSLHDEARFDEVKKDAMQLIGEASVLAKGDPIVNFLLKGLVGGVQNLTWTDYQAAQAAKTATSGSPAPVTSGSATNTSNHGNSGSH